MTIYSFYFLKDRHLGYIIIQKTACQLSSLNMSVLPNPPLGGEACPYFAPFLGLAGAASALMFSAIGAAYGTAKAGIGIAGLGMVKPELYYV